MAPQNPHRMRLLTLHPSIHPPPLAARQSVASEEKAAMGADDESIADGRADVVMGRFLRARQLWGNVGGAPTPGIPTTLR